MNLQLANYEDLIAIYFKATGAKAAAAHLRTLISAGDQERLAILLRNHKQRAVYSKKEINLRAAIDRLIKCCSIMEIASLANFIPDIRQTGFGMEMLSILENKDVRRYYEEFYPEKLPQLFRCRLLGTNSATENIEPAVMSSTILAFLALDRRFMETLDDSYFLRMLDSFEIGKYDFKDLVKMIERPERFMRHLLRTLGKRGRSGVLSQAIGEFSLFMEFCFDLLQILSRTKPYPLTQSAMWNHYSYWFEIIGDQLDEQLGRALAQFLKWKPRGNNETAAKAVQDYVDQAKTVLTVLTSRKFEKPVNSLLKASLPENNGSQ